MGLGKWFCFDKRYHHLLYDPENDLGKAKDAGESRQMWLAHLEWSTRWLGGCPDGGRAVLMGDTESPFIMADCACSDAKGFYCAISPCKAKSKLLWRLYII